MIVMIVDGNRYLINTDASAAHQEKTCKDILIDFPNDCFIEWDKVRNIDL